MAEAEQKNKQEADEARVMTFRRVAAFLCCLALVCGAAHLIYTSGFGTDLLYRNYEVDPNIDAATRARWAQRLELPGVPNIHKVSDELYRGAQPTAEGMQQLEKMGIKTVVNLRSSHSDRDELEGTGLAYEHLEMTTWNMRTEDIVRFLQIVADGNSAPVFVHCQHGADRTGTMCAVYRIAVEGWSKEEAVEEMTKGGFGFHPIWRNLVDEIRKLDVEKIKRRAAIGLDPK